ncbi:hypothetical protein ACG83_36445 [Frankia sp. R43]|uniref:hypothetical protein n=1 Tax=Frankia sp. R43 TaxID=269536 RepID=UPI0006CA38E6|nr:hypothetical protein [Frankia sp. R43]KPM50965.1 hypothetical protein ACG83_36445 [Frankia sp. R43]
MLTPFDDYPVHQTALPVAHAGGGHPDHYDRFWFNGYDEHMFFAVALGLYPNRGIIDAAFSVVRDGVQRSVFASGRVPLDRTRTSVGPIAVDIVEPMRVSRIRVDAPEHGLVADLTATARTAAYEEPRATRNDGTYPLMDVTRATQMVSWSGQLTVGGQSIQLTATGSDAAGDGGDGDGIGGDCAGGDGVVGVVGTKDRSWGVRGLGDPIPAAPRRMKPQTFFLWAPLNFADECLHYTVMEDENGRPWTETAAVLPVLGAGDPVFGPEADLGIRRLRGVRHDVRWAAGLRRSEGATLLLGPGESVELEPLRTFRMKGVGYLHPVWGHGRWHGELVVGAETHKESELDTLAPDCIHVQQVMRARWGDRTGLGVLEQLVIGPHAPSGFRKLFDGAPARPEA